MSWTSCWNKWAKHGDFKRFFKCWLHGDTPAPPTPPIPPIPPTPEPPIPPPPEIPKTDIPYHSTGKLLIYSGAMLCDLCTKDNVLFKEEYLPAYYDALARDGVNAIRSFLATFDGTPAWPTYNGHESDHFDMLRRRLKMIKDRDLTAVLSLTPYGGSLSMDGYRDLIRLGMEFAPNVVFEQMNEPTSNELQAQVVGILVNEFSVPKKNIMVSFIDNSDWLALMEQPGMKDAPLSAHGFGTMESVNSVFGAGGNADKILAWGDFCGSNDGGDRAGKSDGAYFYGLNPLSRRPNIQQLQSTATFMLRNGVGFEHLSALAFSKQEEPDLKVITEYGRDERRALRAALGY